MSNFLFSSFLLFPHSNFTPLLDPFNFHQHHFHPLAITQPHLKRWLLHKILHLKVTFEYDPLPVY